MSDINEAKRLVLAQWEQERDDLNRSIARLRRELQLPEIGQALGESGETESDPKTVFGVPVIQLIKPGDFFGMTQVEAARKTLQHTNKQPLGLQEIATALYRGKATENLIEGIALRNLSSLLSRSDDFISVAKGRWGLAEWYPNKMKKQRKAKDQGAEEGNPATAEKAAP